MFKFDLQQNEKLLNMYRQTELVLVKPVLWLFVLIYVPWFFLIKNELDHTFRNIILVWTLIVFAYAVNKYLLWLLNSYIVTNKRLISLRYHTIFHKQVVETPLERILNISFETKGMLASLFNFGNIDVQIVGLTEPMVLRNIREPSKIKDYLWHIHGTHSVKNPAFDLKNLKDLEQKIGYQQKNSLEQAKKSRIV